MEHLGFSAHPLLRCQRQVSLYQFIIFLWFSSGSSQVLDSVIVCPLDLVNCSWVVPLSPFRYVHPPPLPLTGILWYSLLLPAEGYSLKFGVTIRNPKSLIWPYLSKRNSLNPMIWVIDYSIVKLRSVDPLSKLWLLILVLIFVSIFGINYWFYKHWLNRLDTSMGDYEICTFCGLWHVNFSSITLSFFPFCGPLLLISVVLKSIDFNGHHNYCDDPLCYSLFLFYLLMSCSHEIGYECWLPSWLLTLNISSLLGMRLLLIPIVIPYFYIYRILWSALIFLDINLTPWMLVAVNDWINLCLLIAWIATISKHYIYNPCLPSIWLLDPLLAGWAYEKDIVMTMICYWVNYTTPNLDYLLFWLNLFTLCVYVTMTPCILMLIVWELFGSCSHWNVSPIQYSISLDLLYQVLAALFLAPVNCGFGGPLLLIYRTYGILWHSSTCTASDSCTLIYYYHFFSRANLVEPRVGSSYVLPFWKMVEVGRSTPLPFSVGWIHRIVAPCGSLIYWSMMRPCVSGCFYSILSWCMRPTHPPFPFLFFVFSGIWSDMSGRRLAEPWTWWESRGACSSFLLPEVIPVSTFQSCLLGLFGLPGLGDNRPNQLTVDALSRISSLVLHSQICRIFTPVTTQLWALFFVFLFFPILVLHSFVIYYGLRNPFFVNILCWVRNPFSVRLRKSISYSNG